MDGGDRAGYKQVSGNVDAVYITSTMGAASATNAWADIEVVSDGAQIKSITAAGLINASKISSGTTWPKGTIFSCSKITKVQIATGEANTVGAALITATMGKCSATGAWESFKVVSTEAVFKGITAAGMSGAALIDSGDTWKQDAEVYGYSITMIELSSDLVAGKVVAKKKPVVKPGAIVAHEKILL